MLLKNERTYLLLAFEVRLPFTSHTPLNRVCMISYGNGEVNKKGANTYNECLPWLLPRNLIEVWQVGRCSLKLSALQILLDHVIAITWINRVYVITYAVINTRNVNFFLLAKHFILDKTQSLLFEKSYRYKSDFRFWFRD